MARATARADGDGCLLHTMLEDFRGWTLTASQAGCCRAQLLLGWLPASEPPVAASFAESYHQPGTGECGVSVLAMASRRSSLVSGPQTDLLTLSVDVTVTGSEYNFPKLTWRVDSTHGGGIWTSDVIESWGAFADSPEVAHYLLPDVVAALDNAFGFDTKNETHPSSASFSSVVAGYLSESRRNAQDLQVRFRTNSRTPLLTELPYGCLTVEVEGKQRKLALVRGLSVARSPQDGKARHARRFHHSKPKIALIADASESTGSWAADLHPVVEMARSVGHLQFDRPTTLEDLEPETDIVVIWSHGDLDGLELDGRKALRTELGNKLVASSPLVVLLAACKSAYVANHLANIGIPIVVANATTSQTLIQQAVLSSLVKKIALGAKRGLSAHEVSVCLKDEVLTIFADHDVGPFWGLAEPSVWVANEESSYVEPAEAEPVPGSDRPFASGRATGHQIPKEAATSNDEIDGRWSKHESRSPETPWSGGTWRPRPGNRWSPPPALSPAGDVWAYNGGDGVHLRRLDGSLTVLVTDVDTGAMPIAVSPIDNGAIRLLTVGAKTTDWRINLQRNRAVVVKADDGLGRCGAWISGRFVWSDSDGEVCGSRDLGVAKCTHISSAVGGETILTAWIDPERRLTLHRSSDAGSEVRTERLPDELDPVTELVVAPSAGIPENIWLRVDSTWHGRSWNSLEQPNS